MTVEELQSRITALAGGETGVSGEPGRAIDRVIEMLDAGKLRAAERRGDEWVANAWVKEAILLYFRRRKTEWFGDRERDALVFYDKLPIKRNYKRLGVRCVPPGVARYGSIGSLAQQHDGRKACAASELARPVEPTPAGPLVREQHRIEPLREKFARQCTVGDGPVHHQLRVRPPRDEALADVRAAAHVFLNQQQAHPRNYNTRRPPPP